MKKIYKKLSLLLSLVLVVVGMVGCNSTEDKKDKVASKETQKIVDTYGRYVDVPKDVKSMVILNSGVYDLVCALGSSDKIVGVTDKTKLLPNDTKKEILGTWKEPNVEKILEMKPDVVFGYQKYMKPELAKQIEEANIALVYLDAYKAENMASEISTLGLILGKEKEANEYLGFLNKYSKLIQERVAKIPEDKRVKVYWEGYSDYATVAKGTGGDSLITAAGGVNIASSEPVEYPKISNEWVIEKNPSIIVKVVSNKKPVLGLGIENDTQAKAAYEKLVARTGWNQLEAVKISKTHMISNEIATSPQGSVIGSLYLAKWLYPDKFEDIKPEEIHKEMLEKFYKVEHKGIWTYESSSK
ncbi:ABC transporter substrate-binding protein [Romboutsia maritimum]|uniref:ABC transporter substrate-binding protein n=1 Tax=Romboutsia maritimum TaxID=2020948 RepID=A0A371IX30_9FIRM|nr:ABC transporter substrate-binding protein [Romboutsia maritimum]RDY25025.1 ABC transporter substrate-binding protein [Romboutsia maritimum]